MTAHLPFSGAFLADNQLPKRAVAISFCLQSFGISYDLARALAVHFGCSMVSCKFDDARGHHQWS